MTDREDATVYDELGVRTVINGVGTKTRISGTLMRPAAADAMREAAGNFARISDLQGRASELIGEVTGADAGYVASGAAACLTLGTAACIAGEDFGAMDRLPETPGVADEVVMARTHRNDYDHAFRAAGGRIVDVGTNSHHLGCGATNVEPWQIEDAIGETTAAVAYMQNEASQPPLEEVVAVAHEYDVPVIVDAAAQLPPTRNLSRFVEAGADLVAFSGGKAVRGPQSTGILAGREELIRSVALQHLDAHAAIETWIPNDFFDPADLPGVPTQGLGRGFKVGKEELVGIVRALELFVEEDDEAVLAEWHERAEQIADGLAGVDGFDVALRGGEKTAAVTSVGVAVDPDRAGTDAVELVRGLREEDPRVYVGGDDARNGVFGVNPRCLTDEEADYLVERIRARTG